MQFLFTAWISYPGIVDNASYVPRLFNHDFSSNRTGMVSLVNLRYTFNTLQMTEDNSKKQDKYRDPECVPRLPVFVVVSRLEKS
jgi:hypothetical protein